ncbi:hypothetical protein [Clostridium tagluense]|uniref:Uncharacterized protein n=1 Tax=Clostridium tagluense TaxID=360422 RepID=A0A401UT80_9CLOT|nr:hypothetical protein [Clostridium tagluense]GCD12716.1 hypothetical protein Ctaglu_43390 [Clostridium tagluense]
MKGLVLADLEKLDIIEVTNEEYEKIEQWCFKNKDLIVKNKDNIRHTINEGIIKINSTKSNYLFSLVHFKNIEDKVYIAKYGYFEDMKQIKHFCGGEDFFIKLQDGLSLFYSKENIDKMEMNNMPVSNEFIEYMKSKYDNNYQEHLGFHFAEPIFKYISILIYSQLNQEHIIKQTKTYTQKVQSKKDKRAGKKPKVKLTKQTIITLNTGHIQTPTEEEKREYERHTFGWTVRGHWRTYQSGEKIWIKPQVRGDKDNVQGKVYEV